MTIDPRTTFAQGDLLFRLVPLAAVTGAPVAPDQQRLIMAYGEVTGHHHSVAMETGTLTRESEGVQYLTIDELLDEARVVHQEHDTITLPRVEGMAWQVIRQREWTDADEPIFVGD